MSQYSRSGTGGAVGGAIDKVTGNSGNATPDASHNINLRTSNATVKFVGSGSTITQDFGITNVVLGDSLASLTSGTQNVGLGFFSLHMITSGSANTAIGGGAGDQITTGIENTIVGASTASGLILGNANTIVGYAAFSAVEGSNNIVMGANAGDTIGSSNISIGHPGAGSESNTTRIGSQGTGTGQQSRIFLAGVLNTTSGRVRNVTTPGAYPYTTLITDDMIIIDTSSARTIVPMASPVKGTSYIIKDSVGSAAANNITVTPSGKNIDGAASYIINSNYGSISITYNGSEWSVT